MGCGVGIAAITVLNDAAAFWPTVGADGTPAGFAVAAAERRPSALKSHEVRRASVANKDACARNSSH